MNTPVMRSAENEWKKTACILCSLNCGLEVKTGGSDGREILKVRGDKAHPVSQGYICNKAARLNYYQNGADRISTPLRRKPDGSYEEVSWDIAIKEVAQQLLVIKARDGGDKILFYGGGGQGNHLGGIYADGLLKSLGVKYRANALSQEKTGEFWVNGKMFGSGVHGDFEHCEVALFIGKNPWQSHGFAKAREVINGIKKDNERALIVIDPRRSETAAKADYHVALKPGTDAWCLAALVAIIVQENLVDSAWISRHTTRSEDILPYFRKISVSQYAEICGVEESLLRAVAKRLAAAESVSVFEDLGLQQNRHSTLSSYIQRLIWLLTGNFGKKGTNYTPVPFVGLNEMSKGELGKKKKAKASTYKRSPVLKSKVITGLIPCNNLADEILTNHPSRFRALIVESGNPVHSLADSQRMREAMRSLEFSVVIDVAMTETARQADYVLPASSQYEKYECTFFNLEFPKNSFHLRAPVFEPLPGSLTEPEIHTRLLEAMGYIDPEELALLKSAAKCNRALFAGLLFGKIALNKKLIKIVPAILYRTLGETLPENAAAASVLWLLAHLFVKNNRRYAAKAGFGGLFAGEKLFQAILDNRSGVVFGDAGDYSESFARIRTAGGKINLYIQDLIPELEKLAEGPPAANQEFPLILSAGERRADTTNTIIRNSGWDRKGSLGALRVSPVDADNYALANGSTVILSTHRGSARIHVEISDMMQPGHISLPNGVGLDYLDADGRVIKKGIAPNELTRCQDRDIIAGTPWHKHVAARIEVAN